MSKKSLPVEVENQSTGEIVKIDPVQEWVKNSIKRLASACHIELEPFPGENPVTEKEKAGFKSADAIKLGDQKPEDLAGPSQATEDEQ